MKSPITISLSLAESGELSSLKRAELSALSFWKRIFQSRGIIIPADKVLMTLPTRDGQNFRLEFHPKRLGKSAIAAGAEYRAFTEKKDREFEAKLARRQQQVWQ